MNFEKGLNCYYQIISQSCILCAAETLTEQERCGKRCRSSILVLMAAILVEDIIRNIYVKSFVYEGCPSKSWTFVITQDCVQVTLWYFKDVFIYIWGISCINMGGIEV